MSISLSTPFLRFLPAEPLLWSISVSCGQQGVCVHLQPCPVKYRLFKEVSNIIWPLYCNYKLLLLEAAHRERAAHRHLQSLPPKANAISRSPPADALVSVSSILKDSFTCVWPWCRQTIQLYQLAVSDFLTVPNINVPLLFDWMYQKSFWWVAKSDRSSL